MNKIEILAKLRMEETENLQEILETCSVIWSHLQISGVIKLDKLVCI
jgi:hypothetical protein